MPYTISSGLRASVQATGRRFMCPQMTRSGFALRARITARRYCARTFRGVRVERDFRRNAAHLGADDARHDDDFLDVAPRRQRLGEVAVVERDAAVAAVGIGAEEEDLHACCRLAAQSRPTYTSARVRRC